MERTKTRNQTVSISFTKKEHDQLNNLALYFRLSLSELSRQVLHTLLKELPTEQLADYHKPQSLSRSLKRALRDYQHKKTTTHL